MVKYNNPIPRSRKFKKHWNPEASQKGHVRTFFQQPIQKIRRRQKRAEKAKALFPRPLDKLRPVVMSCSQRFNMRSRYGRGFTPIELKAAGIAHLRARALGIVVDYRRRNHSEEGLERNVQRLKTYLSKVVIYPKKGVKSVDGVAVVQNTSRKLSSVVLTPNETTKVPILEPPRALTAEEKSRHVYQFLRKVQRDEKFVGIRLNRTKRREDAKKEKAAKAGA